MIQPSHVVYTNDLEFSKPLEGTHIWHDINSLTFNDGWRLPTLAELSLLQQNSNVNEFKRHKDHVYWSDTPDVNDSMSIWAMNLFTGSIQSVHPSMPLSVLLVRAVELSGASVGPQKQIGGSHYTSMAVQPWEAMRAWMNREQFQGYLQGNVIKYISRAGKKGDTLEDLKKAQHYLETLIETMNKPNS
jgi:hypothetical protein